MTRYRYYVALVGCIAVIAGSVVRTAQAQSASELIVRDANRSASLSTLSNIVFEQQDLTQQRLAHLELAQRFASGSHTWQQSPSAALTHYQLAATLALSAQHTNDRPSPIDRLGVPVLRASQRSSANVIPAQALSPRADAVLPMHTNIPLTFLLDNPADSVELQLTSPDGTMIHTDRADQQCVGSLCRVTPSRALIGGNHYQWQIRTSNDGEVSNWSQQTFDVAFPAADNLCTGYVSNTNRYSIPVLDKPAYMTPYSDPVFGATVTRITNALPGEVIKPVYSTMQAWNADQSLLLLYKTGMGNPGHYLYNAASFAEIKQLDINPSDIEELYWSYTDPDILYYLSRDPDKNKQFLALNVHNDTETLLTDFSALCDAGRPVAGSDVQMHAQDDDLFGFRCNTSNGPVAISYRISTNETVTRTIGDGTDYLSYIAPAPHADGTGFLLTNTVLDTSLNGTGISLDLANPYEHSSTGLNHLGISAFFQTAFNASPAGCQGDADSGIAHLTSHTLTTGDCRGVINQSLGYPYTTSGTHVSATAYKQPGWVTMSSVGYNSLDVLAGHTPAPALTSEIYLANTNPDAGNVCRLAHHRSFGNAAVNGGYAPYFGEPHASMSPDGRQVVFGSDWYDSGSVDTYIIDLNRQ